MKNKNTNKISIGRMVSLYIKHTTITKSTLYTLIKNIKTIPNKNFKHKNTHFKHSGYYNGKKILSLNINKNIHKNIIIKSIIKGMLPKTQTNKQILNYYF